MRKSWNLKANFKEGSVELVQLDEYGKISLTEKRLCYPFYVLPKKLEALKLKESVEAIPSVKEATIELWRYGKWYEEEVQLVKFCSENPRLTREIISLLEKNGVAEWTNVQPSSTSLALFEKGIVLYDWDGEGNAWNEVLDFPQLKVAEVSALGKSIYISSFTIKDKVELLEQSVVEGDLASALADFHIVISDIVIPKQIKEQLKNTVIIHERGNPVESIVGLMELSRLSYSNLDITARRSIGKILTEIEALEAVKKRMVVPRIRPHAEKWRPLRELIEADSGGLISIPKPGVYHNVLQLDFSSLYPSIIAKYNISPETVERKGCIDERIPPGSAHAVCFDVEGIVSSTLKKLVERREMIRNMKAPWSKERQEALKWIMVSGFGYLGYRNARFGNIYAYETVISISKWLLRTAIMSVAELGFEVLHYIVDSLFVIKPNSIPFEKEEVELLISSIFNRTGFKIKIERIFKWLIIPRVNNIMGSGAPGRYYGITHENSLVIKGVKCPEIDGLQISEAEESSVMEVLKRNRHPRKLCSELKHTLFKLRNTISKNSVS